MDRLRAPKCQGWSRAADRRIDGPTCRSPEKPLGGRAPLSTLELEGAGARATEMTLGSSGWHQDQVADQLRISPRMLQRKLWALDFRDPG